VLGSFFETYANLFLFRQKKFDAGPTGLDGHRAGDEDFKAFFGRDVAHRVDAGDRGDVSVNLRNEELQGKFGG